jgi:mannonate dehydratase
MRTGTTAQRGGAQATHFDLSEVEEADSPVLERDYAEEELWEHYRTFVDEIIPAAERVRIKMALHPINSPTIPSLMGMLRLSRSIESFERAMENAIQNIMD